MPKPSVSAVVVDLGGVVLRVDWRPAIALLRQRAPGIPEDLDRQIAAWGDHYDRYERGASSSVEFFAALRHRFGLPHAMGEVLHAWNAALPGLLPGAEDLLRALGARIPLYAFTNTNPAHHAHLAEHTPLFPYFRTVFASHELGHRKPEPAAYAAVAARLEMDPATLLFFDDKAENVAGAQAAGWQARLCPRDSGALPQLLREFGLT